MSSTPPPMDPSFGTVPPVKRTTGLPRARLSGWRLTFTIAAHAALLALGTLWVISTHTLRSKQPDGLVFTTERPSPSANGQRGEHSAKLSRTMKAGGAPPNARRLTSSVTKSIALPAVPASAITEFQPGRMGGGLGTGWGGFGTGTAGGRMGTGTGGGRIKFFGFESDASSIILAIDTSGSMIGNVGGEGGISTLQSEISRTIDSLPIGSLFNIICFGQDADAAFPANVLATSETKAAARKFMEGYYGAGGFGRTRTERLRELNQPPTTETAELDGIPFSPLTVDTVPGLEGTSGSSRMDLALIAAMQRQATTVFLLSDGQPSASRDGRSLSQDDLLTVIRDTHQRLYNGKPLTIHTIYTNTNRREEDFMKTLSRRFGGRHTRVRLN
jgi:hypothetical protein